VRLRSRRGRRLVLAANGKSLDPHRSLAPWVRRHVELQLELAAPVTAPGTVPLIQDCRSRGAPMSWRGLVVGCECGELAAEPCTEHELADAPETDLRNRVTGRCLWRCRSGSCTRRDSGYSGSYCAVAALNLTTSSAGTRPRSLTSMPWALAHSRTSVVFSPLAGARRPVRAGRRAAPLARRAAPA
jgi:hypothetical protein